MQTSAVYDRSKGYKIPGKINKLTLKLPFVIAYQFPEYNTMAAVPLHLCSCGL